MSIQVLDIPLAGNSIIQGDTIPKISFSFDALDDIDLTGATIKMQIYKRDTIFIDISNDSGITIIDDKTFEIDEVAKELNIYPVGKFKGDLEITLASGERITILRINYTILKQYTI